MATCCALVQRVQKELSEAAEEKQEDYKLWINNQDWAAHIFNLLHVLLAAPGMDIPATGPSISQPGTAEAVNCGTSAPSSAPGCNQSHAPERPCPKSCAPQPCPPRTSPSDPLPSAAESDNTTQDQGPLAGPLKEETGLLQQRVEEQRRAKPVISMRRLQQLAASVKSTAVAHLKVPQHQEDPAEHLDGVSVPGTAKAPHHRSSLSSTKILFAEAADPNRETKLTAERVKQFFQQVQSNSVHNSHAAGAWTVSTRPCAVDC